MFDVAPFPPSPMPKWSTPIPLLWEVFLHLVLPVIFLFQVPGLHILAPSDKYVATTDVNGEYDLFNGTSGAAPQVTGALAAFEWISGWHPFREEAKLLLERTATPTIHTHEQPRTNGVGLLNTYKLAMVARKLKEKCETRTCFHDEIRNQKSEIYKFFPVKGLEDDLRRAFPGCSVEGGKTIRQEITCGEKEEVFKKFRKAALLNPERKDLWEAVSCMYRERGFFKNSEMLERIALSVGSKEEMLEGLKSNVEMAENDSLPYFFSETLKLVAGNSDSFFTILDFYISSQSFNSIETKNLTRTLLETEGPEADRMLLELCYNPKAECLVKIAERGVRTNYRNKDTWNLRLINLVLSDEKADIEQKRRAALLLNEVSLPEKVQTIEAFSKDPQLREALTWGAASIPGEEGERIFKGLIVGLSEESRKEFIGKVEGIVYSGSRFFHDLHEWHFRVLDLLLSSEERIPVKRQVAHELYRRSRMEEKVLIFQFLSGDLDDPIIWRRVESHLLYLRDDLSEEDKKAIRGVIPKDSMPDWFKF